jgi:dinuclear metal center YbgI/SA1388 family protein
MTSLAAIAERLDGLLKISETPDFPPALNGIQLENRSPIRGVAVAVDVSLRTIDGAIERGANLLLVHHGLFWGGVQPFRGPMYERLYRMLSQDVALYSAHLPLDAHPTLGNNVLLARELGLTPDGGFGRFETIHVGVRGEAQVSTRELVGRADAFARTHGGQVVATPVGADRMTRRWAIITGAGARTETLREARSQGVDTLIVGEGPHHTAVEAPELGIAVIYAGHYATETLGVRALGVLLAEEFGLPWHFVDAPTGL